MKGNMINMSGNKALKYKVDKKEVEPLRDKGGDVYVLLSGKTIGMENLIMCVGVTPVNGIVQNHVHEYSEEAFYVLEGSCKVHLGNGDTVLCDENSAVRIPKGVSHWVENTGDCQLKVVFASAPLAPTNKQGHKNII